MDTPAPIPTFAPRLFGSVPVVDGRTKAVTVSRADFGDSLVAVGDSVGADSVTVVVTAACWLVLDDSDVVTAVELERVLTAKVVVC